MNKIKKWFIDDFNQLKSLLLKIKIWILVRIFKKTVVYFTLNDGTVHSCISDIKINIDNVTIKPVTKWDIKNKR